MQPHPSIRFPRLFRVYRTFFRRIPACNSRSLILIIGFIGISFVARGQALEHRDIEYARVGEKSLLLDIFLPGDGVGPFPAVVWVHGGGWNSGSKDGNPPREDLLAAGYASVAINYRLSQEALFPAQIHDVKGAIRWLRAHGAEYNLATDRIGVWGGSAGGHLAALQGTSGAVMEMEGETGGNRDQSSRVQAVVTWAAPTDFLAMRAQALPCSIKDYDSPSSTEAMLLGCVPSLCPDRAIAASPVTYATSDDPPFLLLHGDADCTVPPAQSRLLNDTLVAAGIREVTLVYAPGVGHDGVALSQYNDGVIRFLDRHLKGSVGERPYTLVDAIRALRITAGLVASTTADSTDMRQGEGDPITIADAARLVRQVQRNERAPTGALW